MPKIQLKPNSAEFAEKHQAHLTKCCDMPGCALNGEYKAPKDRGLNEYYFFCLEHVREYNQAWNFFEGMPASEVEDHMHRSLYGDRPTWKYGVNGDAYDHLYSRAWQTYHNTEDEPPRPGEQQQRYADEQTRNTPEYEALALMGLEPPITLEGIKIRYKTLAKKHHPDLNRGDEKSEELLKQINMAYTILKLAYEKFEHLPETNS